MYNQQQLAKEIKLQAKEIATTAKFIESMGFNGIEHKNFGAQYDSIQSTLIENNLNIDGILPQAIIDLKSKLNNVQMGNIFDSIHLGIQGYRNNNKGAMPSAALIASAIGAGAVIHGKLDESMTAGMYDSARDAMGGPETQAMYDSVSASGHSHTAEKPSLAMVTISTIIANAIPIVSYLPNPAGTNTVPLIYVRQVANTTLGQTSKDDYLDGVKAACQYFDNVHRFEMDSEDRTTFTLTTKRSMDEENKPTGDLRLPFVLGATAITVGGIFVANDERSNISGGSQSGEFPIYPSPMDGFEIEGEIYKVTSGKVNLDEDTITITFDKAIPEELSVKASVVANFEAKDENNKYILQAPNIDTRTKQDTVTAYPIRAIYTATIDAITQLQNELGVDPRAAFVAIVISKLMLEQNCRLLREARELAKGIGSERELDLSRGTDLTQAFNNTASIGAEIIPAVEDIKRRINAKTNHIPSGYDIFVTGSLSTVVKSLADDTNFIPTGISFGSPSSITRIGSRGTDHYYYVPESSRVLEEGEILLGADEESEQEVTFSELLVIGRNEVAAKSQFLGHIAVPVITADVHAKAFENGVTIYSRQAAQTNRDSRYGRQVGLLRVINLPKSVTSALSAT